MSSRIEEAISIAESLASKSQLKYSDIYITENNKCIVVINNTLLYETNLNSIPESYYSIAFKYSSITEDLSKIEDDILLKIDINNAYNYYKNNCNVLLAENDDLRSDERFEELLGLKSDNRMKFYYIHGNNGEMYSIPMFSGFLNLNKQDRIGMKLYDLCDNKCIMVNMNIFKKKFNRDISMYMRILKI